MSTKRKAIAIHQPNYLPWLGYFYKMWVSDIFIFHDNVEITKKGYTRRTNIRKGKTAEKIYLTVPLQKHSDYALIKDLQIASEQDWQQKHLNKIKATYQAAPFFDKYFPIIEEVLSRKNESLSKLNISLISSIAESLEIKTEFHCSSNLPVLEKGSAYNLALCKHFNATHYACGKGAKNYQKDSSFRELSIEVLYNDIFAFLQKRKYPQGPVDFLNGLSILDPLFHIGTDGIYEIMSDYKKTE